MDAQALRISLLDFGRDAARHALAGPMSKIIDTDIGHLRPDLDEENDDGGCPTCGDSACGRWQELQDVEAALPEPCEPAISADAVITLLDDPATARWAARQLRRGARAYLREASESLLEATGFSYGCDTWAQRALLVRGSGPWSSCEKRYVLRS